ncbi:hypothetical protein WA026_013425 [Henosepilachna vigintioctopunctata]|uniref:Uncharacterized protein n=1 Tax=Henosepilachna vigintioctopunctata TaxID=420089 RepID=A0AAW1VBV5_9CUCU
MRREKGVLEMAAVHSDRSAMDQQFEKQNGVVDRFKKLYPSVKEDKTPLPRSWSTKEKFTYIGLSQNNLRVHYKGTFLKALYCEIFIGQISFSFS